MKEITLTLTPDEFEIVKDLHDYGSDDDKYFASRFEGPGAFTIATWLSLGNKLRKIQP